MPRWLHVYHSPDNMWHNRGANTASTSSVPEVKVQGGWLLEGFLQVPLPDWKQDAAQ